MLAASQHHYYFHCVWTACELALWPQLQNDLMRWTIVTFTIVHVIKY